MPKDLLLEIGTEEIPAGFVPNALKAMEEIAGRMLSGARLEHSGMSAMGNPRRLVLRVTGISDRQPDAVRVVMGPPKRAAFDDAGIPTKAAIGFAKGQGVEVSALSVTATDKGDYVSATIEEKGAEAGAVLSELLPRLITSIPFPKSMRWMDREVRFARPIHWLLAILGGEVVHFDLDGIKSGNLSRGHRFMSPGAFRVKDFENYIHQTRDNFSIVDPDIRREMIRAQIKSIADSLGAEVLPDEGLVEETAFLVEYPIAVLGGFDRGFLTLPKEVLVNSMREHQRYFALIDKNGTLFPNFITISNTKAEDMEVVRAGNERVLRARLSDAKFFFEEDMKRKLADRVDDLKKVLFQEKLGTTWEKVQRIIGLAEYIAGSFYNDAAVTDTAKRAAYLCKADLVTGMVYEFPNLQGIMGGEYARRTGEKEEVARAIVEHYMPRFSGDDVPSTPAGIAVSVADKIDTIAGIFSVGKAPTGSEDPYALRRQALGIIAIIYKGRIRTSLKALIAKAVGQLSVPEGGREKLEGDILDFFRLRVSNQLTSEGYQFDIVDAVLAREFDDIIDVRERVEALSRFRDMGEFLPFMSAFKRVANIIPEGFTGRLDEALLKDDAEKELYGHYIEIKGDVSGMLDARRYLDALNKIAAVRPYVDSFFDKVMVMDKDEAVKNNRLSLLSLLAAMFFRLADLKKIVV